MDRFGVMFRCRVCHGDFIALVSPATPVPPERCCFCGSRRLLEFEHYEVHITICDKSSGGANK